MSMRRLTRPFLILVAVVFLIEAWLWSHLQPVVAWVVARIPFRALKARLAAAIEVLPPAATLVVFVVPVAILFPFKLLGLWLLAHQQLISAAAVLVLAKLVGTAITAFVFDVTRPKLLRMPWFRWLYEHVMGALAWAHRHVDPIRLRIATLLRAFGPQRAGRTLRLLWRIRRSMRAERRREAEPLRTGAPRAAQTARSP
jgi:hypothetical protein